MRVCISAAGAAGHIAPAALVGINLEILGDTVAGLSPERLANPTFLGPPHPLTRIAPQWQPGMGNNYAGVRFDHLPGMGLNGSEAQLLHNFSGRSGFGLLQTRRWIRAGERLEVVLWARAQHHPANVRVGLRPRPLPAPIYAQAEIPIPAAYWREYHTVLTVPADDDEACFFCFLDQEGQVWVDQIRLRAVGAGPIREDLLACIRSLNVPVLRFPGGCISTAYHWQYGTGSAHLRLTLPDPVFKWTIAYEFGTDEYLALCHDLGITPLITANLSTGTPEEAGEWAAYCAGWFRERGLELPLMYWMMGNEHNGAWELGNMSGAQYAQALREFVPPIRRAYPNSRVLAIGVESGEGLRPGSRTPWRAEVLEQAPDLVDALALQCYTINRDPDPVARHLAALRGADEAARTLRQALADCRAQGLEMKVAMTEWNLWQQAAHYDGQGFLEPYDAQHALFAAAMLNHFVRLSPDLELACFYHLVNPMGVFISRGPEVVETCLAEVFRLYRQALPGQVLRVAVNAPGLAEGISAVDAACLRRGESTFLFLANRSLDEPAEVDLEGLPEFRGGTTLVGEAPDAALLTEPARVMGNKVLLPPLSLTRLDST